MTEQGAHRMPGGQEQPGGFGHHPGQYGQVLPPGGYGQAPHQGAYGQVPPSGGYGQAPHQGGYGQAPPPGAYGHPTGGPPQGPSPGGSNNRPLLWVLLGLMAVLVLVIASFLALGVGPFSGGDGSEPSPTSEAAQSEEEPTDSDPDPGPADEEPEEPSGDPQPVAAADSLSSEGQEALGTVIEVATAPLRFNEAEMFDSYFYQCLFTVNLENLTDVSQEYELGFTIPGNPDMQWSSNEPQEMQAGEALELVLGWEDESVEELGISGAGCSGEVELTALSVDPG